MTRLNDGDESLFLSENLALIDTHPESKNNPIPEGKIPLIVIDHHNNYSKDKACYSDVRPGIGATSTILTQYLEAADCHPYEQLATALLYGIKTDTMALSRNTTTADVNAYCYLSSLADIEVFQSFEKAQVPAGYFKGLAAAMTGAKVYDNGLTITYLKDLPYPDLVAEIADLFLRLEGSQHILSMGTFEEVLHFSIRTTDEQLDVNKLAQVVADSDGSAGGREMIAGGQIPLDDEEPEELVKRLNQRILDYFKISQDAEGEQIT
jgi:nanoRNase/pAp phosphatase (c-di-AMP/oligoRNAs hydrolase)